MRSMYSPKEVHVDMIPVDIVIKAMILATWKYAVVEYEPYLLMVLLKCLFLFNN